MSLLNAKLIDANICVLMHEYVYMYVKHYMFYNAMKSWGQQLVLGFVIML